MDPRPFKLLFVCIVLVLDLLEDGCAGVLRHIQTRLSS